MTTVYVINKEGEPLDPTTRCGHVRILLKEKRARVVSVKPFTIQLLYETEGETKVMCGATDPGRTNIGNAVITEEGDCLYRDKVETRTDDIPKLMEKRKAHRQSSRRGERQKRKRRAKRAETLSTKLDEGRLIPGTEELTPVKDIINTEARFMNRKKKRTLCPTTSHLVETTLQQIDRIRKILPVKKWCLEVNRFAFMKMEDGSIFGTDFQNGRMRGYACVEEYIYAIQDGRCAVCGEPISACHHIVPKSKGGSDLPENRVGLCGACHSKVHHGKLSLESIGKRKQYGALSVLNQAMPYIYKGLVERFGEENVYICSGRETMAIRDAAGLEKDHDIDALSIASICAGVLPKKPRVRCCRVRQFRRQERALIQSQPERTYKLDGKAIAKNRKPRFEQSGPSLADWYEGAVASFGRKKANAMLSGLTVRKSYRRYNDPDRLMPGAVILWNGITGTLTGQQNNGYYYMMDKLPGKRLKAADCTVLKHNTGLVYV